MKQLSTSWGTFTLRRWPSASQDGLQAWDAADELILGHVYPVLQQDPKLGSRVLVINDAFGSLATSLQAWQPQSWTDSWISAQATVNNYQLNAIETPPTLIPSVEQPNDHFTLVLIRIPKTLALLEDQIVKLRPCINEHTVVVCGSMLKHLPATVFNLLGDLMGSVTTSLAKKKARLLFVQVNKSLPTIDSPYPVTYSDKDAGGLSLVNHANVFSKHRLDHGTRFLLSFTKQFPSSRKIVDLGCGNGVLGLLYQRANPGSTVVFVDESYMAMASAKSNHARHGAGEAEFMLSNGIAGVHSQSVDLVLCNPPFHQQHVIGKSIAYDFFKESFRCLSENGELWVVANRHLNYKGLLKTFFGGCVMVGQNSKFHVLRARKSAL